MNNLICTCNCFLTHFLFLLVSIIGTIITVGITLIVYIAFGCVITALVIISVVFFLLLLIALFLLVYCIVKRLTKNMAVKND